jgi:NAD(P)-dependent dehydrogenase (short-subunit alcohol dehydrogenase family)
VSSTHAVNPRAGMGQYDVAKAGILSMTRTLAFEEAANRVRVNAVCPGLTLTPFHVARAMQSGRTEHDLRTEQVDHNCSDAGPIRARSPIRSSGSRATRPPSSPPPRSWSTARPAYEA